MCLVFSFSLDTPIVCVEWGTPSLSGGGHLPNAD